MSLFDLTGKVALITGSSRGIGRAIALRMAEHGAPRGDLLAQARGLRGGGRRDRGRPRRRPAVAIPASISVKAELEHLVAETESRLGPVDVLVCNAASNPYYGPLAGISDAQFRKILENNVLSNHWLIQMVAPGMVARRDGAIVIVSSIGALKGSPVIGAYNVSKAADLQLARNYAVEYGPANVRVNCLCPGLIRTDFARALWEDPAMLAATTDAAPCAGSASPTRSPAPPVFLACRRRPVRDRPGARDRRR
ncbi:short-chain dehydrogenase, partial [Methylobacterium radiotolerans]